MDLSVGELVQRFESGEIRLPIMQREYVWKASKVVNLLDSLYRGWPIGSFYVWQTRDAYPAKDKFGKTLLQLPMDGFYGFLLDGQQRLTSLSLAIRGDADGELPHRGFFDLENERFYLGAMKKTITKRIEREDPLIVPLSEIVAALPTQREQRLKVIEGVIQDLPSHSNFNDNTRMNYRQRLNRIMTMFDRKVLCEEFRDDQEAHAFDLFSRLNKGGTSLSAGDVEAARLASASTKGIVQPMREMVSQPYIRALGINFVFLLRSLVTVHRGNCSFSKLPRGWADDTGEIEASWKKTEQGLRGVVRFVGDELGWTTRRWLPSTMALIPPLYMLAESGSAKFSKRNGEFVKLYLLVSGLRSLFRGAPETAVNSYVNAIRNNSQGDAARALYDRIPKNRRYPIQRNDVLGTSGQYSPLMQTYLAYLYTTDVKSWPSGRSLRDVLHDALLDDPLAVHHIFPKKFMLDRDFPVDRLNTVANYAIISQADNAELGDRDPFDVWRELKANQRQGASVQLCFIAKEELLQYKAYDEFIDFRAEKLAERLNKFVGLI